MERRPPSWAGTGVITFVLGGLACAILIGVSSGGRETVSQAPPEPPTPAIATGHGLTLTSVSEEFPDDDAQYPAGPHAELMNANCTACHSATMALYQPRLTSDQWQAEVEKMRQTYHAPVAETAVPEIVDYLTAMSVKLGPKSPPGVVKDPMGKVGPDGAASG